MGNATYLFEKPERNFHNSESFWSSLFAIYILITSNSKDPISIPIYKYRVVENKWRFEPSGELSIPPGLSYHNVVVEGKINESSFENMPNIPPELYDIRPDIIIKHNKMVHIVEIKTIGHKIGEYQKSNYEKLVNKLKENGYEANLYFLLSVGHEHESDWAMLAKDDIKILLWEDVLKLICNSTKELRHCFGNITEYYENIGLEG